MNSKEVIMLWKEGHSRKFLYDKEFKEVKIKLSSLKKSQRELRKEAINNIEKILLDYYNKEILKRR